MSCLILINFIRLILTTSKTVSLAFLLKKFSLESKMQFNMIAVVNDITIISFLVEIKIRNFINEV